MKSTTMDMEGYYSEVKEVALMDSIRTRIAEYYLLGDISIRVALKQGIPLTAMSLGTFAPTLRY